MECIAVGNGDKTAWIIHRQHPGETMAEFFCEGLLHRILGIGKDGEIDDMTKKVLDQYRIYIVPCMCPDGAVMGHLRTNSVGANLNREWATVNPEYIAPSMERSPEVYAVLKKMDETGCDFFLDVHGDEELPYVFLSGAEKTPLWEESERLKYLHGYFVSCYQRANSDIQKGESFQFMYKNANRTPISEIAHLSYLLSCTTLKQSAILLLIAQKMHSNI